MDCFNGIYKDKTVLITGHTGFKGSWLSIWLIELGAKVIGYALDPYTEKDNFILAGVGNKVTDIRGDIRDFKKLNDVFQKYRPEFVFHLAAQPLVGASYKKPLETFETNVMGTINILDAIRHCVSVKTGIIVTTDKCYENKEQIYGYRESDKLGGYDPYSSSKACAELAINSWRSSFMNPKDFIIHGKAIASVRAGNVIGGGDWAQDRLIPDCIKSLEKRKIIKIRKPDAVRPWQHVLEPLGGYLLLGEKLVDNPQKFSQSWNFGPELESLVTVQTVVEMVIDSYGEGEMEITMSEEQIHETGFLNLDITKAVIELGWKPMLTMSEKIQMTIEWYKKYENEDVYELCTKQIEMWMKKRG